MPKKKKKKRKPQGRALKRVPRLKKAKQWLAAYDGVERRIVRHYRDKFKVDIPTALRDLQEIGYVFSPGYVEAVLQSEERRIHQMAMKKVDLTASDMSWRDDHFYFIAGYTSGDAPYGVTWEEMGMRPYEDEWALTES